MKNKDNIQIPNILNKSVHSFESVLSKRIFYAIEAQIKKGYHLQIDIEQKLWLNVPTKILGNQHFRDLDKATDELQKARFKFVDPENEAFNKILPFPNVEYQKRWGFMKVQINPSALKYLAELTNGYFWMKLKGALQLNSKYAQRWYDLFSSKTDLGYWDNVEVDYIRKIMGVDAHEYKTKSMFFKRVVYLPIQEINEKTELFIEYDYMLRQKRPVVGFDFTIRNQKAKGEAEIYKQIEKYYDELKAMTPFEIQQKINEIHREYSITKDHYELMIKNKHVLNAVLEADAKIKAGKVTIQTTKPKYMWGVVENAKRQ